MGKFLRPFLKHTLQYTSRKFETKDFKEDPDLGDNYDEKRKSLERRMLEIAVWSTKRLHTLHVVIITT